MPEASTNLRNIERCRIAAIVGRRSASVSGRSRPSAGGARTPKRDLATELVLLVADRIFEQLRVRSGGGNPRFRWWLEGTHYEVFDEMVTGGVWCDVRRAQRR